MKFIFLVLSLCASQAFAQNVCRDQALVENGWVEHSSGLSQIANRLKTEIEKSNWVPDLESTMLSPSLRKHLKFSSFDNLDTPQSEMFGDVAFYADLKTGEVLEVRWYADGKKHFAHSRSIDCSVDGVPFAVNALF